MEYSVTTPVISADVDPATIIQLENVDKFFGAFQALKNINLSVKKGERIVFIRTLTNDSQTPVPIEDVAAGQYL